MNWHTIITYLLFAFVVWMIITHRSGGSEGHGGGHGKGGNGKGGRGGTHGKGGGGHKGQ